MVDVVICNEFIEKGFSLLPLQNNSKIPADKWAKKSKEELNCKTLNSASNNFGIRTGKISDIFVLDIDDYKKECHIKEKLLEIDTYKVKTPRGGSHIYFRYNPKVKTTTNEELAIDIRSDGGYVVAPTSTINGNSYEVIQNSDICYAPEWLLGYIFKFICKQNNIIINENFKPVSFEDLKTKVMGLDKQRASNYDDWLKIGFIIQTTSLENDYYEKGRYLFHEFSEQCEEKYDVDKTDEFYDKVRETDTKIKYASLVLMYNKDNNLKNGDLGDEYSGDKDLAIKLYEDNEEKIINTSNGIYCKHNILNIWIKDHEQVFKTYIQNCNYYCYDKNQKKKYINEQTSKWKSIITQLETYIFNNMKKEDTIIEKMDNYRDYIPFLNCCYDLVNQKWINCLPEDYICSNVVNIKIDTSIEPTEEEISQVNYWFDSILEEYKQPFISYCIRMLGGNYTDKKWLSSIGLRNSGKGVLEKIFSHLFGNFVGQIDSKNLECKNSMESTERSRGCLEPFSTKRLVFSSEARPNATMDGTLLKSTGSGGDQFFYRQSYGTLQSGYFRAGFVFQANTLPKIDPTDAYENMLYFPMPCKFVSKDELENNYGGYKIKEADPFIKEQIIDEKYRMAFYKVIFSYYNMKNPYKLLIEKGLELREDEEGDTNEFGIFEKMINENFVITKDNEDTIKAKELNTFIKNNGFSVNADRIRMYLKTMGVTLDKKGTRIYRHIKEKD